MQATRLRSSSYGGQVACYVARIDTDEFNDRRCGSLTKLRHGKRAGFCMNSFEIAVYLGLMIDVVTGFNTGLLRSALTILAYIIAMPIALVVMYGVSQRL